MNPLLLTTRAIISRRPSLLAAGSFALLTALSSDRTRAQTAPGALPTGGQVTAGSATINQSGNQMTVNQTTNRLITQWNTFDIGQNAGVQFNQPNSSSVALNRIQGQNPSQILGSLNANGQVFLINPNGIYFGKNATVNVGGLVASSLALADEDFLAGKYTFNGGLSSGKIINAGNITAGPGGVVALVSFSILNEGTITAEHGSVALAAGRKVNLDFSGDGMINLKVDQANVNAQVENKGLIKAPGGVVIMTAKAARSLAGTVVNNSGIVEANTMSNVNGRIILDGGDAGVVENTGTLSATGMKSGETGGSITMTGEKVGVLGNGLVDASGDAGGGSIAIGGGFHGKDATIANAQQTLIGENASIKADAGQNGNGGKVAIWSDKETRFYGNLSARGGQVSGDGGTLEISSKGSLGLAGRIDASATNGTAGTLLLDPRDITIAAGGAAILTGVDNFSDTSSTDVTIDPATIQAATNAGTAVTLQANNDIFVNSSIVSNNASGNGGTLTFQAGRSITLNASVTSDSGNVFFTANDSSATSDRQAGTGSFTNNSLIDAGGGNVSITLGTNAGGSGSILTGQVTAANLTIAHNGPTVGAVTGLIDVGEIQIANNLSITTTLARNLTNAIGNVIVRGTATIDVGAGDVTINRSTTDFNLIAFTHAGNVVITDTNALRFGTSTLTGGLTANATGPIAETGIVIVGGAASLTASNGGFGYADPYIDFSGYNNDFQSTLALSVNSTGQTGTGGYATIKDVNGLSLSSATTARNLIVNAGGVLHLGTISAGTSVDATGVGAADVTSLSAGSYFNLSASGAVDLGTVSVGSDLTVTTSGAITDSGTITVPSRTYLTAGAANNITLDTATNNFADIRIISGNNVTLVDTNAIEFGDYSGGGHSAISGNLSVTAGGSIGQYGGSAYDYAHLTVGGTSTFTVTAANSDLLLGPAVGNYYGGYTGGSNSFAGTVTLATSGAGTYRDVLLRNTNSNAAVISGLGTGLRDVLFYFDNASSVTVPGMTLTGSLIVDAPSGGITQSGAINVDNSAGGAGYSTFRAAATSDVILNNPANDFYRITVRNGRDVTLVDTDGVELFGYNAAFQVQRNLSVTAGGPITDGSTNDGAYFIYVTSGTATLNAGSTNNITLDNSNNYWSTVLVPAANNVVLSPRFSLVFGNSTISGSLYMSSLGTGSLTQLSGSTVTTGSTTTFDRFTGGITLNEPNNVFGNLVITSAGAVNIRENDAITQGAAWSNNNTITLATSNDQAINLGTYSNTLGNLIITQINNGAGSAGAVSVKENDVNGITQGGAWTTHGNTLVDSSGYGITLTNTGNVLGPLQVLGGTLLDTGSVRYPISITENNTISDYAAWSMAADSALTLKAYAGGVLGAGNISLTQAGNLLGAITLTGATVTITENRAIVDGTSPWTTTGTTTLNAGTNAIALSNVTNSLGPIAIGGAPSSVLITDNTNLTQASAWTIGTAPVTLDARTNAIDLSTSGNVLGALNISTANGTPSSVSIREDDAITQGSAWNLLGVPVTLYAENSKAITFTNASNRFGNLTLTGGTVNIVENDAITQGATAWNTGATTLNPTGNAITLSNTGNVMGALSIDTSATAVTITENDNITQAAAWNLGTAPISLNSQTHDVLLTQTSNQLGDLTIRGQNASIVESHNITDGGAWTVPGLTTLTAGVYSIVLDASPRSNFGTLKIISAASADISDIDGLTLDTSSVTGMLSITAGGEIVQIGALSADSLRLVGAGFATLTNSANNINSLAAGFSGGPLTFVNSGNFAVAVVGGTSGINIGSNTVSLTSATGTITGLTNVNASSTGLTLSTGTGLTLPQITIAGPQSYTSGTVNSAGITLSGNVTSNAAGVINFNSPVSLSNNWVVQSANSNINFASTLAGATHQLTVNAGSGQIDFAGAVSGMGAITDASVALTTFAGGTGTTFHSTLAANNGISVTGPVVFIDDVTLANGLVGSTFSGQVTLGKSGGMTLSGYDNFSFNGGVLLQSGAATINSNNSTMTFAGSNTLHGPYGLTLNSGTQTITGLDHVGTDITSLAVTANTPTIPSAGVSVAGPQAYTATSGTSITLSGPVTSTAAGTIAFNSPTVLGTDATVTAVNSAISFASTVDGAHDLTVDSGSGAKSFTGRVGNITVVGDGVGSSIILQGAGATTFSSTVATRSGIFSIGPISFVGNVTMADGDTGSVFDGLVTTGGTVISGYDGLSFVGGLTLTADTSVLSNGSTLSFGGPVMGAHALTLNALSGGAGTVTGLNQIDQGLTALTVTAQTLSLPSAGLAVSGPMTFTAAGGITLNGAVGSASSPSTGQITFNSPVILATGAVAVSTANSPIIFNSTINGAQALSVNAGTNSTTFAGSVGGTTPIASLATSGTALLNGGSVTSSGAQTYNNAVTLGANSTLTGSALTFSGTLNGAYTLAANVSGATTFGGIVGGSTALSSITTDSPGSVVFNTSAITTSGAQTYNELATLGADLTLTGTNIHFANTVDGAHALTFAASGTAQIDGATGGTTALSSLSASGTTVSVHAVTTTGVQTYTGAVTLNGNLTTTNSNVTVTGATTLGGDTAISTGAGAGDITFSGATSTINGAHALSLAAGTGDVLLGGVVGGITPVTTFAMSGNDLTIPVINSTSTQTFSALNNLTLSQSRTSSVPLNFTADSDGSGSGSFILPTGVTLVTSNQALTIRAADLDLQGTSTINTGSGLITVTPTNARNLFLGGVDTAGQMTITADELSRISTSGGVDFKTTGTGWIKSAGIAATDSQNISGVLRLYAQGSGDVSFVTSGSTFNALTAQSGSGVINLGQNVTTTNDPIIFASPVATAATVTVASGGGNITFQSTLADSNPLTLQTSGGTLTFSGNVTGTSTLTIALVGGSVTGLDQLQSSLTGLTLSNNASVTLPAITINGPQVYNGPVSISGNLTGTGLAFNNTAVISANNLTLNAGTGTVAFGNTLAAGTNNFTLTGDEINFANTVTGTGNVVLQPSTSTLNTVVGGSSATSALDLTASDLAWLPSNLGGLTIGRTAGTGTLSLATATNFGSVPLTLNGGGGISQAGALTAGALTLRSGAGIDLSNTGNVLGAITVLGAPTSVSIADSTNLTQGAAWVLGSAPVTLNAGSNAIVMTQAGNTLGTVSLTGGAVQLTEASNTDLGASTASSLAVISSGGISTSGTVAVSGAATFKTLEDSGRSISIGNASTFGSLSAVSRNAADTTNTAGTITIAPGGSTLLKTLATTGNITLTSPSGATLSQDGTSTLNAAGLELLGSGNFALTAGANVIATLAGNTATLAFRDDGGFSIGTVNTVGFTSSGNVTLSSTGTVTQLQKLIASGVELLGTGGSYTLNNSANGITTLAGNTGTVNFRDDSGFGIGTVNTAGLTTTGNTTLSSTGTVTQSQKIAATGLELVGAGGTFTLNNVANAITTLAANTGTLSFLENSGFAIGTVNTVGVTTSGNTTLSSTGAVTQSQDISTAGLELLGTGGSFTLTRDTNTVPILAGNFGSADLHTAGALVVGTVNTAGVTTGTDLSITAGGAVTQTQNLHIGRDLNVTTTHSAGDVTINNNGATSTRLGSSVVGGDYTVTAQNGPLAQVALTNLKVVGDLTVDSPTAILDGSGNLIGGTTSLPASTSSTLRQSGVITLGNRTEAGDLTVVSEAATRTFDTGPIHGTAISLNNAGNSVGGAISVNTVASGTSTGSASQTGIVQAGGTSLNITGVGSFTAEASTAGSLGVILNNTGNSFGQLRVSGNIVNVTNSAARVTDIGSAVATTSFILNTAEAVTQSGSIVTPTLSVTSPGAVTLGNVGNNVASLSVDANGAIVYTDADSFSVAALNAHAHTASLTAGSTGVLTQSGAVTNVTGLTLATGGAVTLNSTGNTIDTLASVQSGGAVQIYDSAGGLAISGLVRGATGDVTVRTNGDLTLASGGTVTATTGNIALSAESSGNFINNSTSSALTVGSGDRWLVYSKTPDLVGTTHTIKGGLTSAFRLYGKTFVSDNPASIASSGNGFIYADSPTVTLTISPTISGTASHVYGNNPTATLGYAVSSGFVDSEDTGVNINLTGTPVFDTTLSNTMNAGVYTIHYTSGLSSSYPLIADTAGVSYTVSQAPLTYTANSATRVYGNTNPGFGGTLTGFKLGQDTSVLGGAITWSTPSDVTSHVGSYGINGSGYTSSNYTFVQAPANATALSVTARPVTLTADNTSRYYGNSNPTTDTFTVTTGNLVNSDTLATTVATTSPATLTSNVGNYSLTPSSANFTTGAASDYAITYANGTLAVAPRPITLTATDLSRTYGNANPTTDSFAIGGSGLANTDTLGAAVNVSSPALTTSNVGTYTLTPSGAVFTSGSASNYAVSYAAGTLSVTARSLTITASNLSRVYGNANPTTDTFTVSGSGLVGSDGLVGTTSVSSVADNASHVGTYSLTPGGVTFSTGSAANYNITYANGALQVTARPITLTASNQSRVYGDSNPTTGGYSVGGSGLVNGDVIGPVLNVNSPASATSNVGSYSLTPSAASFTTGVATDYGVTYANGSLDVTARPITLTANPLSRTYGNANPTTDGFSVGGRGLANTDALVSTLAVSSPATTADHVGNYALVAGASSFSSGSASNYAITYANGILGVTPRPISVTADNQSRAYGDANPTTGTFALGGSGLVNGDSLAPTLTVGSPALTTSSLGSYVLAPSNPIFTNGQSTDYAVSYFNGSLTVTPRPITITANNQSRTYGDANPTLGTFTVLGGLANTDTLASTVAVTSPATLASNVGNYSLASGAISFSSGSSSNYTITYAGGTLTVTPAALAYLADTGTRLYGDGNPLLTGTLTGFKNSDTLASATTGLLSFSSAATATSNVGSYAVVGSGITANHGNYTLVQAPGNSSALSVTPRPLIVSGSNLTRLYGDPNPTVTAATASGLVNGDTVSSAAVVLSATQASSVGSYTSIPSTTTFSSGLASNYAISYVNGVLTITPRPLTITAANATRVYGENNPSAGVTVGDNLVNGDTLGLSLLTSSATPTSNVGGYSLAPTFASFTQGSAGNYLINYASGVLSITPRPVTVTATSQTKVYGASDPTLTYQVEPQTIGRGFLPGESLGGSLVRTAGENVSDGPYAITQGSLATSNSNYTVSFVGNAFTITPALLTYTANAQTGVYSPSLASSLNGTVSGFVRDDTLSSATTGKAIWTTNATQTSPLGNYAINGAGLQAVNGNYKFAEDSQNETALTINGVSSSAIQRPYIPLTNALDTALGTAGVINATYTVSDSNGSDMRQLHEAFAGFAGDFGTTNVSTTTVQPVYTEDWISLPTDAGAFYAATSPLSTNVTVAPGLATFSSQGGTTTLSFNVAQQPGARATEPQKTSVSLYLESNGGHFPVGSFVVVDNGSRISMAPVQDAHAAYPDTAGTSEPRTLTLQTANGESVEVTVSLSQGGLLVVSTPVAFIEAKGVRNIALAGVAAAKQKLGIGISKIRGVSVAAQN